MKLGAFLILHLLFTSALAAGQSLTIQGKVLDGSNNPVNGSATQFRVQILSPDGQRCVLFDETHVKDLSNTGGLFSINLNDSTGTANAPNNYTLEQALSNRAAFTVNSSYCASGSGTLTYTPGANDNRKVVIQFRDPGTMSSFETIPEMDLNPVAWSMESRTVGGFPSSSLLRVVAGGTPGTAPALSTADITELQALTGGTSTKYMARDLAGGARLPSYSGDPASPAVGSFWLDTTGSGTLKFKDSAGNIQSLGSGGGGGTITGITASGALTGGGSSGAVTISLPTTGVTGFGSPVGSASSIPVITFDSYGRLTAVTSAAISGTLPGGTNGEFLKSGGGSTWASSVIKMGDLKNVDGDGPLFGTVNCTASQTMYWDSGADQIRCQNIAVGNSQIADLAYSKLTGVPNLVANAGGTPSLLTDTEANLPTVHVNGRIFFASDTKKIFRDNGTTWDQLAVAPNAVLNALNTTSISTGPTASQPTGQVAGRIFINTTTQKIQYDNGTAWIDVASNGGTGFSGSLAGEISGTQSATQVDSINGISRSTITTNLTAVTNATDAATPSTLVKRDTNGDFAGRRLSSAQLNLKDGSTNIVSLKAHNSSATYSLQLPAAAPTANQILQSDASGVLSWINPFSSAGVSVSAPLTNPSGTIGIAQASGSSDGYLTSASFTAFTNKLSKALTSAHIFVGNGSGDATDVAASGNVSLDNTGKFTVTGIRDQAISSAGTNVGQVLRYSATNTWSPEFLTMKDLRSTVTGTQALTSSCTAGKTLYWDSATDSLGCQDISIAAATQITGQLPIANGGTGTNSAGQNLVFAGPSSGAGAPAFRALAAGDLPSEAKLWAESSGNINRASGNVGINSATPGAKLDVVGTGALGNATVGRFMFGSGMLTGESGAHFSYGSFAANTFAIQAESQGVAYRNLLLNPSGGNVGIGTAVPAYSLHVAGPTVPQIGITSTGTSGRSYTLQSTGGTGGALDGYFQIIDRTAAAARMYIDANGNASFTSNLAVGATPGTLASFYATNGDTTGATPVGRFGGYGDFYVDGPSQIGGRLVVKNSGYVGIGTTAPTVSLDLATRTDAIRLPAGTNAQQPGQSGQAAAANGMIRYNTSNNALEAYVNGAWTNLATVGGTQSFAGNVNVGGTLTSTGAATFNGGATIAGGVLAMSNQNITGVGSNITGTGALTVASSGTNTNLALQSSGAGAVNVGSSNGTSLSVLDGGASTVNYVTVKGAAAGSSPTIGTAGGDTNINLNLLPKGTGNVGIGTTAPGTMLQVQGAITSGKGSWGTSSGYGTTIAPDLANGIHYIDTHTENVGSAGAALVFRGGHGSSETAYSRAILTMKTATGNVGIGTTNPGALVDIFGSTATQAAGTGLLVRSGYPGYSGTTVSILALRDKDNTTDTFNVRSDGSLTLNRFSALNTYLNSLTVDNNGNVGIGTSSPGVPLEISGSGVNRAGLKLKNTSTGGSSWFLYSGTSAQNSVTDGSLAFYNDATAITRFVITPDGAVGIGTTAPTRSLSVVRSDRDSTIELTNTNSTAARTAGISINNFRGNPDQGGSAAVSIANYRGTASAPLATQSGDILGTVQGWGYGTGFASGSQVNFVSEGTWTGSSAPGAISFGTVPSGSLSGQERMRIAANGNVGIGSTAPNAKLEVNGAIIGGNTTDVWTASRTGGVAALPVASQSSTSWSTVPGLSITFTLSRPAKVNLNFNGELRGDNSTAGSYLHAGIRFNVDGVGRGQPVHGERLAMANSSLWWNTFSNVQNVTLPAGTHTVAAQVNAFYSGAIGYVCAEWNGSAADGYSDCTMTITAVYQ